MDWKEFSIEASEQIVNLIRYTAWPAIVLAIVLLFKKQLTGMIDRIKKFKFKDNSIYFENVMTGSSESKKVKDYINQEGEIELMKVDPNNIDKHAWFMSLGNIVASNVEILDSMLPLILDEIKTNKIANAKKSLIAYKGKKGDIKEIIDYFDQHRDIAPHGEEVVNVLQGLLSIYDDHYVRLVGLTEED